VDKKRIGIWGWVSVRVPGVLSPSEQTPIQSYGGFMSSKVVEANAGIHSLAMAVAVRSSLPWLSRLLPDVCARLSLLRAGDYTVGATQIED